MLIPTLVTNNLVQITENEHDVVLNLLYGTSDNFTNKPIYHKQLCYLHKAAFEKFLLAKHLAKQLGLRIKIFDAFRPQLAQEKLWTHTPDPIFLADPKKGSNHTRGVAIDLTLVDFETAKELNMGTPFDDFTALSYHGNTTISKDAQRNRFILLGIMTTAGFDFYQKEWWHYQLFLAKEYPLILDGIESDLMMAS